MATNTQRPPRDDLVRAIGGEFELRDAGDQHPPTMVGHFARFNEWTEIDSVFEGRFMEQIAPGAFTKTIADNPNMRVLFEHGLDPQIGTKPLGTIATLQEDKRGAYYEVELLDAPYVRDDILPGLRAGLYGSSFRFSVMREQFDRNVKPSPTNPEALPERTLKEVAVREFGPVTFPAYAGATAAVRSMTDEFMLARLKRAGLETRMDNEDLSTLAQMMQLATAYIDEQDEPEDQANIPVMQDVLRALAQLVPYELSEDEGPEDEDASAGRSAPPPDAAALAPRNGTPRTDPAPWPKATPDIWEELWTP